MASAHIPSPAPRPAPGLWRGMGEAVFRPLLWGPMVWSSVTLPLSHSYPAGLWRCQLFGTETLTEGEASGEGRAPWGLMAGGLLNVSWVLSLLCVLQMVETVSGARAPSVGAHISSPFPAAGVSQTSVVDVSIHAGNWYQAGMYSDDLVFTEHLLCTRH